MKTKEELNALKAEVETLSEKLRELTEDELEQVIGGRIGLFGASKERGDFTFDLDGSGKKYAPSIYKNTLDDFR